MKATITFELDEKHHPGKPWVLAILADPTNPVEAVFETREDAADMVATLNTDGNEIITIEE